MIIERPDPMRTSGSLLTEISKLKPGDHLCCIYETEEEHRALLTPYLRQGLERNEKVVYIVDARTGEAVLDYLRQSGLDTRPFLDKGQLVILSVADAYMREGAFIPDRMISFLRQETDRTVGEGYAALRVTGEMSWALRRLPGSNHLIEYESKLNSFLPGSRCLALCQYDKRRFPPELLLQVLATHPIAVIGTETFENVHYISPEVFLAQDFSTAILGHWIEGLRIRRRVKAGEDALRESEGRFRAIFENSMDGILVTVPDGGILAANPTACKMLGRTEGEVCKAGRTGVVDPSDPRLPVLLEERARKGMCHGELTFVRGDGTKFPVDISSRLYKDRYGNPLTSMVFRDITERKKAEEKQRASDREISESQRVAHVGSWDWDAAADSIRWSDEYYRIYSIDPDLPTPVYIEHLKIYTPECRERLDAAVKRAMQTGEGYELDLELADRAGPTRWICARGEAKRDPEGRIVGLRGTAQDITERKLLENQFLQAQKMEAVGRLAGGIAHDFNNLLTVTTGYCDLALARIGPQDPLRHDLEEIRKSSDRCAALTRQILAFSRKQILVPKVIHLGDVVADMDKMLRRLIGEDIDLVSVWGKDLWNVKADPGQIEQVIVNLAVNARDAMTQGGKLTIETANVVLDKMYARGHQCIPRLLRDAGRERYGVRNGRRDVVADLRALLHDEGEREGDRARSFDGLRDREAERRLHQCLQRAGDRDDVQDVLPVRRGIGDRDIRGGRPPIRRIAGQ
jgi:PAS domain S-box-containing protein